MASGLPGHSALGPGVKGPRRGDALDHPGDEDPAKGWLQSRADRRGNLRSLSEAGRPWNRSGLLGSRNRIQPFVDTSAPGRRDPARNGSKSRFHRTPFALPRGGLTRTFRESRWRSRRRLGPVPRDSGFPRSAPRPRSHSRRDLRPDETHSEPEPPIAHSPGRPSTGAIDSVRHHHSRIADPLRAISAHGAR